MFLSWLTFVAGSSFANPIELSSFLDEMIAQCGENQSNTCLVDKRFEVEEEFLCGLTAAILNGDKDAAGQLLADCFPSKLFDTRKFILGEYVRKSDVLKGIGKEMPKGTEVITFRYSVEICNMRTGSISGALFITPSGMEVTLLGDIPRNCND